jgi:class 3 adenylate cyclase
MTDYDVINIDDLPVIGSIPTNSLLNVSFSSTTDELSFSGEQQKYCVCFIDIINSTTVTSNLNYSQVSKYYSVFLNAMATIVRNFGAKIIKNAGDCLIFYFPATSDSSDRVAFKDVLECCLTMIEAHRFVNSKLSEERLPPVNYRISADYGMVAIARSVSSGNDDLFGSTMNRCAKINSKAQDNGMVIGNDLHDIFQSYPSFVEEYQSKQVWNYMIGEGQTYPIFAVQRKQDRIILNPFKCISARITTTDEGMTSNAKKHGEE